MPPRTHKPILDDAPLNSRFAPLRRTPRFAQEMGEAKGNLAGYLAKHFSLSRVQLRSIQNLPASDLAALNTALDRAVAEGLTLIVNGCNGGSGGGGCTQLRTRFAEGRIIVDVT